MLYATLRMYTQILCWQIYRMRFVQFCPTCDLIWCDDCCNSLYTTYYIVRGKFENCNKILTPHWPLFIETFCKITHPIIFFFFTQQNYRIRFEIEKISLCIRYFIYFTSVHCVHRVWWYLTEFCSWLHLSLIIV